MIGAYGPVVLSLPGAPAADYALLLGLWQNQERVETRRALQTLEAIRDSFSDEVPLRYFQAGCETDEEAEAQHAIHRDRVRFAQQTHETEEAEG